MKQMNRETMVRVEFLNLKHGTRIWGRLQWTPFGMNPMDAAIIKAAKKEIQAKYCLQN